MIQPKTLATKYQKIKVLYRISDLINTTTNPSTLLRRILRESVQAMKASSGTISFIDSEHKVLEIVVSQGIEPAHARKLRLSVGQGVTGCVAQSGRPLRVDNVQESKHYVELKKDVRSELAVPLKADGILIGVLNVDSTHERAFTQDDEKLLAAIGVQAARIIHTSRLYEKLQTQTRRLETLFEVGQALISPDPLPEVLNRITRAVLDLMEIKLCSVMLLNEKRELVLSSVSGGTANYSQRPNLSVNNSLLGEVVTKRQPMQVFDVKKAPRYRAVPMARREHLASLMSVPIFFHEQLIGIINIYTARPRSFEEEEQRLLKAFASLCGIAIINSQRYEQMLRAENSIRQTDRLATLGVLSAEIAHEIRNPITIITMLLHSLREDNAIVPGHERDVSIITEKLERINRIVSQVLNFSKRRELRLEWVDVNSAIEELLFLLRPSVLQRQVLLRRKLDPELPQVLLDRGALDQVLLNLMVNALDAMPTGGILSVRTSVSMGRGTEKPRTVSIAIRDTGTGIAPEVISQLFTPFVSTRKEGIGLGLFVSHKLLSQYGGRIKVRSLPRRGTVFTVHLPIEAVETI